VGLLCVDAVWLALLIPLYRAGLLRAVDLGLRTSPAARSVGLVLLVFVVIGVMFGLVHTEYALGVLPELAVYGGLLCVLYERTGSLLPGIALNVYLDAGGFEQALTGRSPIVLWSFGLLVLVLVARSMTRRMGRLSP
jgi:membrane protease YdiL (CAAX protease family)